ncbi:MAG TPA: DUF4214 domain-containing protein, partial [Telluria sp.]|nr:DUF4214 domain-containing protein [Telluria sp.]
QHTALVIDASNLPVGSKLVLNSVDFAAIVGAVSVTGNTPGQILTGDAASQQFTVASGTGSSVFSGGGDDRLLFNSPATSTAHALRAMAAITADTTTILHGGAGNDSAVFNGASSDYTVEQHESYVLVTAKAQPTQHALLVNVESLTFSDTTVTVETSDAQSALAGLYQSVLGRQADYQGFDFWARAETAGVSLGDIALAMISSKESQGSHTMVFNGDNTHDLQLLYQDIFNRAGDAAGLAFWGNAMAHGVTLEHIANEFVHAQEMEQHKIVAQNWDFLVV